MGQIVPVLEGPHSELGPSSADRWINCPGSVLASRGKPDIARSYAIEGTAAHTLSEWVRNQGKRARTFKGITIRVERGDEHTDVLVDDEMVQGTQEFVDRVQSEPGMQMVETLVTYSPWVPRGFGTLDGAALQDVRSFLADFKYGEGVRKDAKMNPQLMLYALGVVNDYGWMFDIDHFDLAIIQPRLDHYDEWRVAVKFLLEWAEDVAKPAAIAALTPGAKIVPGEWCQFCRIRATCRERSASLIRAALPREQAALAEFNADLPDRIETVANSLTELTNQEMYFMLKALKPLAGLKTHLEEYGYREVDAGRDFGGMKIVAGRSSRDWTLEEGRVVEELKKNNVVEDDMYERKFVSVAKAEDLLPRGTFAPEVRTEDGSIKKPAGKLAHLVRTSRGKPTLVEGTDRRPSIRESQAANEAAALNDITIE